MGAKIQSYNGEKTSMAFASDYNFNVLYLEYSHGRADQFATGPGINTNLSFAYYITKANLTISLGFRYQLLYYFVDEKTDPLIIRKFTNIINNEADHFYGILITAIYSFKIKK